jgi:hypothetical protein
MKHLQVSQHFSTAFHPQTDGQTERVNSILEQYLRCYIDYQQSNWKDYLCIAQFAYNNTKHSTTQFSPFEIILGYHPTLSIHMNPATINDTPADQRAKKIQSVHEEVKFNIAMANEDHQNYYNNKVMVPPILNPGDQVWLSSKNIQSKRTSKKFDHRQLGPFKVIEPVGTRSYRLELPGTMKIHPVFHVNLLEKFIPDQIPGRTPPPQPPIAIDGQEEYEVESIVDSRHYRRQLQYLVHWKGYTSMDRTWEAASNLDHCQDLVQEFHATHPDRPSSRRGAPPKKGASVRNRPEPSNCFR